MTSPTCLTPWQGGLEGSAGVINHTPYMWPLYHGDLGEVLHRGSGLQKQVFQETKQKLCLMT